jgi:hypothetical protein
MQPIGCGQCLLRSRELDVVQQQLREQRERTAALEQQLVAADQCIAHVREELARAGGASPAPRTLHMISGRFHETADGRLDSSQLRPEFRASAAFPFRYVPPVDFLPEVFVEQFADVLGIVDRYAQEFHRSHVGGTVTNRVGATERDVVFLKSRVALLEAQLRSEIKAHQEELAAAAANVANANGTLGRPGRSEDEFPLTGHAPFTTASSGSETSAPDSPVSRRVRTASRTRVPEAALGGRGRQSSTDRRVEEWRRKRGLTHRAEAAAHPGEVLRPPGLTESWQMLLQ